MTIAVGEIPDFKIERPKVIYRQITERIREMIQSGEIAEGSRLPSTAQLAAKWDAQVASVHLALTPLVKEGLLVRYPKKGTFVTKRTRRITQIGIYQPMDVATAAGQEFGRAVYSSLAMLLEKKSVNLRVWTDTRPLRKRNAPMEGLQRAVERREIQGLVGAGINKSQLEWLEKLPVITSFFTTNASSPRRVGVDYKQAAMEAVETLARQKVRHLALICNMTEGSGASEIGSVFRRTFLDAAAKAGMTVRPSWLRVPSADLGGIEMEMWGYEQFRSLWSERQKPDGLFVFPSNCVRGVILAILRQQVRVPEDLKVVFHRNVENFFLCPFAASWLETSTKEIAGGLIRQVWSQFDGESVKPILLPFRTASSTAF